MCFDSFNITGRHCCGSLRGCAGHLSRCLSVGRRMCTLRTCDWHQRRSSSRNEEASHSSRNRRKKQGMVGHCHPRPVCPPPFVIIRRRSLKINAASLRSAVQVVRWSRQIQICMTSYPHMKISGTRE